MKLFEQQLDTIRINWRMGSEQIIVDRTKIIEHSLSQVDHINLHKVNYAKLRKSKFNLWVKPPAMQVDFFVNGLLN